MTDSKKSMWTRRKWPIWIVLGTVALSMAGCGPPAPAATGTEGDEFHKNSDGYADISVEQLSGLIENGEIMLVNVHVPYEGEIPETDLFIPFDEVSGSLSELPDKEATIVLYCRSGSMSTSAAEELAALGYTNILELDGGFRAWEAAGRELLRR